MKKKEVLNAVLTKIDKEYEYIENIGSGAFSGVHLIRHKILQQDRALKIMNLDEKNGRQKFKQVKNNFIDEAKLALQFHHPNIARIYDISSVNHQNLDIPYIIMEYTKGLTLREYLNQQVSPSIQEIWRIAIAILDALSALHAGGVIHRDIKPENIIIENDSGRVILLDFGFATKIPGQPGEIIPFTPGGTPVYMAPEQFGKNFELGQALDIYAFGVLLYEMLSGEIPFKGNFDEVMNAHLKESIPDIRDANPLVPFRIKEIIEKAMAKLPGKRYKTAKDIQADLKKWIKENEESLKLATLEKTNKESLKQLNVPGWKKWRSLKWPVLIFTVILVLSIIFYTFYPFSQNGEKEYDGAYQKAQNFLLSGDLERAKYYANYAKEKKNTGDINNLLEKIDLATMQRDYDQVQKAPRNNPVIDNTLALIESFLEKYENTQVSQTDTGQKIIARAIELRSQLKQDKENSEGYKTNLLAAQQHMEQAEFEVAFKSLRLAKAILATEDTRDIENKIITTCISKINQQLRDWDYQNAQKNLSTLHENTPQVKVPRELEEKLKYVKSLRKNAKLTKNYKGLWEADFGNNLVMIYIPGTTGFWMGKTEVSIRQYMKFPNETGSNIPEWEEKGSNFNIYYDSDPYYKDYVIDEQQPIVGISFRDATAFCRWLSRKTGLPFKIPSEEQWKNAAQDKTQYKFPWGHRIYNAKLANYASPNGRTDRVNSYPDGASPYGLINMSGNVEEWCTAPGGPLAKGGSVIDGEKNIQIKSKRKYEPGTRNRYLGFRLCLESPIK